MRKKPTFVLCYLSLNSIWCILILPACSVSNLTQKNHRTAPIQVAQVSLSTGVEYSLEKDQFLPNASTSTSPDEPAAASRPHSNLVADASGIIPATTRKDIGMQKAASQGQKIQKKLSLPARMLLKHIAKKAEKLQKKDISRINRQEEINNKNYLILGIVLLAAGLVLVLVGSTTLLYILGAVASLAGLIFLLLAIL